MKNKVCLHHKGLPYTHSWHLKKDFAKISNAISIKIVPNVLKLKHEAKLL